MEPENTRKRHIDHLASQIIKAKEIRGFTPEFLYSLELFDQDFYDYPEIDWKNTLEKIIQHLFDLKDVFNSSILNQLESSSQDNSTDQFDSDPLFEFDNIESRDDTKGESISPINHGSPKIDWDQKSFIKSLYKTRFDWIDKNLEVLNDCIKYYEKYEGEPPYDYPIRRRLKIPFLGGINEFAVFANLLEEQGNFFITERSKPEKQLENYKNLDSTEFVNTNLNSAISEISEYKITKIDYLKILSENFVLIDFEGKNLAKNGRDKKLINHISLKTLSGKSTSNTAGDLTEITFRNFVNGLNSMIEHLKQLQKISAKKKEEKKSDKR